MFKKKLFSTVDYKKKYKRMRISFIILLIFFAAFVYINYDYTVFKFLISYNYVYTEVLNKLYIDEISEENFNGFFENFDTVAIAAFTEKIRTVSGDMYTYLYTPQQYEYTKEYEREIVKEAVAKELLPDTAYMYIPSISKYTREFIYENKAFLKGYKNIVIDLRDNPGGTLEDMYKIADLFLKKGQIIAYEETRNPLTSKTAKAKSNETLEYQKIIFLQNQATASACEGLIMALKENLDNVTVIGETSFGKGIGQFTMPIKNGFAIKATVMYSKTPKGGSIHQTGITPDVEYTGGDIIEYTSSYLTRNLEE